MKKFFRGVLALLLLSCVLLCACENVQSGVSVSSAYWNAGGELILVLTDGSEINCGAIEKDDGKQNSALTTKCLLSSLRIYAEFRYTDEDGSRKLGFNMGSGIIYLMDDEFAYVITNYHVLWHNDANTDNDAGFGQHISRSVKGYLYGNSDVPSNGGRKDEDGYPVWDYGNGAFLCKFIGGSAQTDIAVLQVEKDVVLGINPDARPVSTADDVNVGDTALAIGNTRSLGLSVTKGIVSVDSENVLVEVGGVVRNLRLMRMDTPIYNGNSGGGLFNDEGQLIGIVSAGEDDAQNITYAVPIQLAKKVADNIIFNYNDGDDATFGVLMPFDTLGLRTKAASGRFVWFEDKSCGKIVESVELTKVTPNSVAASCGLQHGDVIKSLILNGTETAISRLYMLTDFMFLIRSGDRLQFVLERDGQRVVSEEYTFSSQDFSKA